MSEEEKKAFERLKSYYLQNARGNREIQKIFEPIFDLIAKQQQEIESANNIARVEFINHNFIPKQKIKDKIEELENFNGTYSDMRLYAIRILNELLEE